MDIKKSSVAFAAFLRDTVDAYTRRQFTFDAQARDGFTVFLDELPGINGVRAIHSTLSLDDSKVVLEVAKPTQRPTRPTSWGGREVTESDLRRHQEEMSLWQAHTSLYEKLFASTTLSESMELVFCSVLLATTRDENEYRRHLLKADCSVNLVVGDGRLQVVLRDSASVEANWLPGDLRERAFSSSDDVDEIEQADSINEMNEQVAGLISKFGTTAFLLRNPRQQVEPEQIGVGCFPAIMLRRRDSSSTLTLLEQIVNAYERGDEPSEPFKMIVSSEHVPTQLVAKHEVAALPLEANDEQRETILSTLTERHVVIQGPPGTGKTHTIANLASLLMAEGRRVLITAENDHALTEVQGKLPQSMQSLLLPFFRDSGSSFLEKSVNQLIQNNGNSSFKRQIEEQLKVGDQNLRALKLKQSEANKKLIEASDSDRSVYLIEGQSLTIAGHLKLINQWVETLELADAFLDGGDLPVEVATSYLPLLSEVEEEDWEIVDHRFPETIPSPDSFQESLAKFRSDLNLLREPLEVDYSPLDGIRDKLIQTSQRLQSYPQLNWQDLPLSEDLYREHAKEASRCNKQLDLKVGLLQIDVDVAVRILESFCQLQGPLAKLDLDQLRSISRLIQNVEETTEEGIYFSRLDLLVDRISDLHSTSNMFREDVTRLLIPLVEEKIRDATAVVGPTIEEVRQLRTKLDTPIGQLVRIEVSDISSSELLDQAVELRAFIRSGGKFSGIFGAPRAVRKAAKLLDLVTVGGSKIDTPRELDRAIEVLEAINHREIARNWLESHLGRLVTDSEIPQLVEAVDKLPENAEFICRVHREIEAGLDPSSTSVRGIDGIHNLAFAKACKEARRQLASFKEGLTQEVGQILYDGEVVRTQSLANKTLLHLRALSERESLLSQLPPAWKIGVSPAEKSEPDKLEELFLLAAEVASLPSWARRGVISPRTFNEVAELAVTDAKRRQILTSQMEYVALLLQETRSCVPTSTATSLIAQAIENEDPRLYREAFKALEIEKVRALRARRLRAYEKIMSEVHPRLFDGLKTELPSAFDALNRIQELSSKRNHRAAVQKLTTNHQSVEEIHRELHRIYRDLRNQEAVIANARCWVSAISRLESDRSLSSSLSALVQAITKVPKTRTAKTFRRRVRGVQDATKSASPAIPCWLMSIDRIPEVLGSFEQVEKFDVVIVDEASQAWFSSLFLYALAEQVIIVGDDMQTSPTAGGVLGEDELRAIVRQHVPDHRIATQVGDDLSIYDIATTMTAPVTLVDHFRCVPEIIKISNEMSYKPKGKTLLPIRTHSREKLDPVVRVRLDGQRSSSAAPNLEEIDALVTQVLSCLGDKRYKEKSFGIVVVGTQPTAHIKRLREELLLNVGPREMNSRQMRVGSASEFQGSERDVIFLSLVDAPPINGRLRTRPLEYTGRNRKFVQQLNVAVSRARDQLWIFHSFGPEDLGESDARHKLIERLDSQPADLQAELQKCNGFESDVVRAISQNLPEVEIKAQVEALGYFIDIVLTHPNGERLAVECDGDRWHTDDSSLRSDLYRQRALERNGWRFYRFLASEWYADESVHLQAIREFLLVSPSIVEAKSLEGKGSPIADIVDAGDMSDDPTPSNGWAVSEDSQQEETERSLREINEDQELAHEDQVDNPYLVEASSGRLFEVDDGLTEGFRSDSLLGMQKGPTDSFGEVGIPEQGDSRSADHNEGLDWSKVSFVDSSVEFEIDDEEDFELEPTVGATKSDSPQRLSKEETSRKNRSLAAELRKLRKDPRGDTWMRAKDLLSKGYSIEDAARDA